MGVFSWEVLIAYYTLWEPLAFKMQFLTKSCVNVCNLILSLNCCCFLEMFFALPLKLKQFHPTILSSFRTALPFDPICCIVLAQQFGF